MTCMDDQSAHFVLSKSALIPQIQTQVLSHHKKNWQIPCVLLEAKQAEGKSLFQQPVMMISHNLGIDCTSVKCVDILIGRHGPLSQPRILSRLIGNLCVHGNNVDIAMNCKATALTFESCSFSRYFDRNLCDARIKIY